jgi:DNA mismatch repair ATPase MutS
LKTHDFYASRISYLKSRLDFYQKRESIWAFARLFAFIGLLVIIFAGFSISAIIGIILILPSISVFGIVINKHLRISKEKLRYQYLYEINVAEVDCLNGDYSSFANGNEYFEKEHPYLNDLDILGQHSIYQYINRTNTQPGAAMLADWLKQPAKFEDIKTRQEAIAELAQQIDWRQNLRSVFYLNPSSSQNPDKLIDWCNAEPELQISGSMKVFLWGIPATILTLCALVGLGVPGVWLSTALILSFGMNSAYIKKINKIQVSLSKSHAMLQSYADIIRLIEGGTFASEKLTDLKSKLDGEFPASKSLKKLSDVLRRLDYRLNILIGIPLNLVFLWDIHQCLKLEKWKAANRDKIREWFNAMAEFEALSSLANLSFNNPRWVFPLVTDDYFHISMKEAGHPLILPEKRILNDFTLDNMGKIALITGSNMSGKSTFLRTCGVNIILAMAGAPVCAEKFEASYVRIFSSMRIADSLEENTSSFYAELKKLAQIIKVVEQKEKVFLLLDEILRGTNSNDRHTGSVALIRQLIKNGAPAIIATHDLALSSLTEENGSNIEIYNFDVKILGEELFFDYKINPGICKSLNASILMKKMGIDV